MLVRRFAIPTMFLSALAACAWDADPPLADGESTGTAFEPLTAVCSVNVEGVGTKEVESDYLPHVVMCENGAASFEALKAQAVAARTYLYYSLKGASGGTISDGQNAQVYTCARAPTADVVRAVGETAGEVLRYKDVTIAAFFVAGGKGSPPACIGASTASTEKYVTYNEGLAGTSIHQTTLGSVNPANMQNRGCMSQNGSDCLAKNGSNYEEILHFYYGSDIAIERGDGACVPEQPSSSGDAGSADGPSTLDAGTPGIIAAGQLPDADAGCAVSPSRGPKNVSFVLVTLAAAAIAGQFRKGRRREQQRV